MVFYVLSLNTLYVYNGIITQFCKFNLKKIFNLGSVALEQSALRKLLKAKRTQMSVNCLPVLLNLDCSLRYLLSIKSGCFQELFETGQRSESKQKKAYISVNLFAPPIIQSCSTTSSLGDLFALDDIQFCFNNNT